MSIIETLELDYATLTFHPNYVIGKVKSGVSFDKKHIEDFGEYFKQYYQDTPYVYISRREHDYNVNPIAYIDINFKSNLVGMAVVCENPVKINNATFEKNFFKRNFEVFETLKEAIDWAEQEIKNAGR